MRRRMLLRLCDAGWRVALLCALCPACAFYQPSFGVGYDTLRTDRGVVDNPAFGLTSQASRTLELKGLSEPLQAIRLLVEWGPPDERQCVGDDRERWTYVGGLRGVGVVVFLVVLPLPLVVPTGRESVTFLVERGKVTRAWSVANTDGRFCATGWTFLGVGHGGGWFATCRPAQRESFSNPFN